MADIPMDPHTEAIVALQCEVADFRRHVDQRFAAVDQRLDTGDQRFAAIDRRFEALERRLDEQGSGLRALIESLHSDVRLILEHLSPAMTQINRHEQRFHMHEDRLDGHDTRLSALERRGPKPS